MAAENANSQRDVHLTCTIRLISPGNMANVNPGVLGVDINDFEDDLAQSFSDFITDTLNAQDDPAVDVDDLYVMRLHSNVVANANRALPDGNVFNMNAFFTIKYNNQDFWDYADRFMDRDIGLLSHALVGDFSDRIQNINNVAFLRKVEMVDIEMDDEMQFVVIQPVAVAVAAPNMQPAPNNNQNQGGYGMNGGRRARSRRSRRHRRNTRRHRTRAHRRGRKN